MLALGVGHGDRVALLALNEPEYFDMLFGLGKIAAILVPINYRLAGPEIEFILSDCEARVFVFGEEFTETVDSIRSQIPAKEFVAISDDAPEWATPYETMIRASSAEEPAIRGGDDDTLTILYTSGTTGRPKGAQLSHSYYFWSSVNLMATLGRAGRRFVSRRPPPVSHRRPGRSPLVRLSGNEDGPAPEPRPQTLPGAAG